jgi:hypothetical protein
MQKGDEGGLLERTKEALLASILLRALPYALLISSLTVLGLFGGFALGKGLGCSIAGFAFALLFSFSGFFFGLFISYRIVK